MSRPLRYIPSQHTIFEVTCRTMQARFLLKPSTELNSLVLGIIGRALSLYNINIYLFVVVSNHMQFLLSAPNTSELARFMNHINGNIAREAGRLHHWLERFWGRRYSAIPVLDDESIIARAKYILSHGCKEGLVSRPSDWPGINCVDALTTGTPLSCVWVSRTKESARKNRMNASQKDEPESALPYEIRLSPLPAWADLTDSVRQARWRQMVEDIEVETGQRLKAQNTRTLGRAGVLAQHPHSSPDSPKKSPRPFCHAVIKSIEKEYRETYREFVGKYREAFDLLKSGKLSSLKRFPESCYIPPFAYREFALSPG